MADEKLVTTAELNAVRDQIVEQLLERIEKTETTLLKEFRRWAASFESRFKANETLVGGFNERLVSLEERVSDLESGEGRD
jgi:recombinational DNA repair ATPase RecF